MMFDHRPSPVAVILYLVAVVAFALALRSIGSKAGPILTAKPLLSAREQAMLDIFEELLPGYRFHTQVAMGALLKVKPGLGRRVNPADRNSFAQKIVDFVAQDRASGKVVALIEIDDASHRVTGDKARDALTSRAGYRTISIPMRARPTILDVQQELACLTSPGLKEGNQSR